MIPVTLLALLSTPASPPEAAPLAEPQPGWVLAESDAEPTAASLLVPREPLFLQAGWRALPKGYVRLSGGVTSMVDSDGPDEDIEFDEGYLVAGALGLRLGEGDGRFGFALELEGVWTDQDAGDQGPLEAVEDVTVLAGFLNGVVDFRLNEIWSLYLGAGIGAAAVDVGTKSDALNDFNDEDGPYLAWQARAGTQFWAGKFGWNLGYRFMNVDDVEIDDDTGNEDFDLETQQHVIELGLTFGF